MAWCRFTYTAIRQVVLAIVKTVLAGGSLTKDDAWKITWNTLYDLQVLACPVKYPMIWGWALAFLSRVARSARKSLIALLIKGSWISW